MIFKNYPWHISDQPAVLKKADKKLLRKGSSLSFLTLLWTNVALFPFLFLKFLFKKNNAINSIDNLKSFYGLCVNLDKGSVQVDLVNELGVKSLQIRFYLSDMKNIDKYVEFAKSFGADKEIMICVIQSRSHIENHELLTSDIKIVFEKFSSISSEFMIGNAVNRIKWGFVTMEEYLHFFETVQRSRDKYFPELKLIGSSVIDFEFHFTIRSLFNNYKIHFDRLATLLYVDRRGSPRNTQYGIFDLQNKINFLDIIVKSSSKSENIIYITEVNWPLKNTASYAPTSENECVSEDEYTNYMIEYFDITRKSGKIKKVFWHQLIAPGYGLVDNKEGLIRKMPQFYAMKEMVANAS